MILKDEFYQIMDQAIRIKRDNYQRWPIHIVAQAGKVFHKSGELMKAASEFKYELAKEIPDQQKQYDDMRKFAYETIATTLRFLERLKPRPVDPNAVVEEQNPYQIMMPINPSMNETEFDLNNIPEEILEQAALGLDEPDHSFSEKEPIIDGTGV